MQGRGHDPRQRELFRQVWFALSPEKRTTQKLIDELRRMNLAKVPSLASVKRWAIGWRAEGEKAKDLIIRGEDVRLEMTVPAPALEIQSALVEEDQIEENDGIPAILKEVISPRVWNVAPGKGFEKVENAVGMVADAIAGKAPEIAAYLVHRETETSNDVTQGEDGAADIVKKTIEKASDARGAVSALVQLATAMHTITMARSLVSVAHRNFGEGDRALAEAQAILEHGRAERATLVNGRPGNSLQSQSAQEEALAALRDTASR